MMHFFSQLAEACERRSRERKRKNAPPVAASAISWPEDQSISGKEIASDCWARLDNEKDHVIYGMAGTVEIWTSTLECLTFIRSTTGPPPRGDHSCFALGPRFQLHSPFIDLLLISINSLTEINIILIPVCSSRLQCPASNDRPIIIMQKNISPKTAISKYTQTDRMPLTSSSQLLKFITLYELVRQEGPVGNAWTGRKQQYSVDSFK